MAAKVIATLTTLIANIAVGIAVLVTMIIAMNGYGESDAMWGLGAFVVLAVVVAVLMALGAFFLAGFLTKKPYGIVATAIIPILIFSVIGAGLDIVSSLIGVGVAEFVRIKF
jgi:hypothetical protein